MAANLMKNGHELVVYNRTREKAEPLAEKGAKIVFSPAEVGEQAEILITMLSDPDAVRKAALGEKGFLMRLEQKALWIDCSTVNPSFSKEMKDKAGGMNIRFVDAPVAGTIMPAEKGELIFLVGGDDKDIEEAQPLFDAMGKKTVRMGGTGMGSSIKMVINLMLGQAMAAFAESLTLGESLGISKEKLFEVLLGGPAAAPFLAGKKNKISENEFSPEFPLRLMRKDFHLVSVSAFENNLSLPVSNAAKELYASAVKHGMGDDDFSAVFKFLSGEKGNV
jgi:3-hydroxyisobutyrate dehydrogenase/glyoxylate/succinic semialdehyde reductase